MTITGETLTIVLGVITLAGILLKAYDRLSKNHQELKDQIGLVKETLERKDFTLESLIDKQNLTTNHLTERINHHSVRLKAEIKEMEVRIRSIEGFLIKTSSFETRHDNSQGS